MPVDLYTLHSLRLIFMCFWLLLSVQHCHRWCIVFNIFLTNCQEGIQSRLGYEKWIAENVREIFQKRGYFSSNNAARNHYVRERGKIVNVTTVKTESQRHKGRKSNDGSCFFYFDESSASCHKRLTKKSRPRYSSNLRSQSDMS